jgi:hypothetical protein
MDKGGGPVGNIKARKHGMHSVLARGEAGMTVPQKSRYIELKELFESEPGRLEYRKELTALLAEVCEQGFSQLRIDVEASKNIWTAPGPLKMLAVYANSLTRLLDSWPKEGGRTNVIDMLKGGDNGED